MFKKIPLIIVFSVALFTVWPLLRPGFIPTHDGEYHLIRFFEFDKNIKAGNFFPRWAPGLNNGLGVPLFNFFYPLPNYVGEFFHLLGFSFINSFKLTLVTGLVLAALFFYLWLKEIFGVWPAAVGAVFYTLAPYHLLDMYVRGSVGEVLAMAFFPAVLWAVEKRSLWTSFFLALLILSHNLLAFLFMPFLISYLVLRRRDILNSLFFILIGFGLSCYFWLPALAEAKYVVGLKMIDFADHFPAFFQLVLPSWGSGFSRPGVGDQLSFQIGIPHLLVVIGCLFWLKKKNKQLRFFLFWFLLIFILLLEISLPIWRLVLGMNLIQYPWRLLSLMVLAASFLAGFLVFLKKSKLVVVVLILLALGFYAGYTRPVRYPPRQDEFYLANPTWTQGTATLGNSFNTKWVSEVTAFALPAKRHFETNFATPTTLQAGIAYFPGWQVFVDGKKTQIDYQNGLINFDVPQGNHEIKIKFGETPIRILADAVSFFSLLFFMTKTIVKKRSK